LELAVLIVTSGISIDYPKIGSKIDTNLVVALGAVAASGALGYVFSFVHHTLYWGWSWYAAADQRAVLDSLRRRGVLTLQRSDAEAEVVALSRAGAWRVFTAIWHSRIEVSGRLKGATARAETLTDLMHGSGATLIGSMFAVAAWFVAASCWGATCQGWLIALAVSALLVLVHWCSYRIAGGHAQGFTDIVLFHDLSTPISGESATEPSEGTAPTAHLFWVSKHELEVG